MTYGGSSSACIHRRRQAAIYRVDLHSISLGQCSFAKTDCGRRTLPSGNLDSAGGEAKWLDAGVLYTLIDQNLLG